MIVKRYHGDCCGGKNLVVTEIPYGTHGDTLYRSHPLPKSLVRANDMLKVQSGNKWTHNHMNGTPQLMDDKLKGARLSGNGGRVRV